MAKRWISALAAIALLPVLACGGSGQANTVAPSPSPIRCAFGASSYANGERICEQGTEKECRTAGPTSEWFVTGHGCKSGEPLAVPAPSGA